jgi:AAA family ATP:ADP antiporter
MGVQVGAARLQWLFSAVFVAMIALVPVFGWLARRLPVARLLPTVYGFFALSLFAFYLALESGVELRQIAPVFFVWVSVFNLFVVSVFWSFMADLYTTEAARRLFGFIAAGGSLGAVVGPGLTTLLAPRIGIANLLLVSTAFLVAAIGCIVALLRIAASRPADGGAVPAPEGRRCDPGAGQGAPANPRATRASAVASPQSGAPAPRFGAPDGTSRYLRAPEAEPGARPSLWIGVIRTARSPYLAGICVFLVCYTLLSTLLYFMQTKLVPELIPSPERRTQLFAAADLAVNALTLLLQLFATGRLLSKFGVTLMLAALPAVSVIGFLALGVAAVIPVLIVFGVLRRAGEFAISKPARETLFTVVSKEEKYQAKNVIDTVIYRGGDAASGWLAAALLAAGLSLSGMAFVGVPVACLWFATAIFLGRRHESMRTAAR